ncbi:MAG TPA: hypothetical protein QF870_08450, partial [Nitrospinota bacterium]|nr:hypothetical protein [Nitrospinota bacterium]
RHENNQSKPEQNAPPPHGPMPPSQIIRHARMRLPPLGHFGKLQTNPQTQRLVGPPNLDGIISPWSWIFHSTKPEEVV